MALKEEDILEEAFKIINLNKSKASSLRNSILNLNQNIYNNNLHLQTIQYLSEFEYDLKTLIELLQEFLNKSKKTFQKKINSLKSELNTMKKENNSLKDSQGNKNKYRIKTKNKLDTFENKIAKKNEKKERQSSPPDGQNTKNLKISSQNNFYPNKARIIYNNKNINKNNFCDYNSFISNIKRNSSRSNNIIRYDLYKKNNKKEINNIARGRNNNSARAKSVNSLLIYKNKNINEDKKEKIINEIFQDERILNALKKQFGNEIEDKLLNEDINMDFLLKVEEISDKIKKSSHNNKIENGLMISEKNKSFNLKLPKRFSNNKDNYSIDNLIITS